MKIKDILVPTLTLVSITLVVTVLLVVTNNMTSDKIAELLAQSEEEAKQEVLAAGDSFSEAVIQIDGEDVTYFVADNGAGYVFSTANKGYGGAVVVMTGISSEGEITGVKVTSQNETPGLGQKALDTSFTEQYKMPIPENGVSVTKSGKVNDNEVDAIAGATITTNAVTDSVNDAIEIFYLITGGGN